MPTKPKQDIREFCETKALGGDGAFAIAYALLELSAAQKTTARALDKLGFNDERPTAPPGTTESIAMELKRIADALADRSE